MFRCKDNPGKPGNGRIREMGLGSVLGVSLAKARTKAATARAQIVDGVDPIGARDTLKDLPTFGDVADAFYAQKVAANRVDKTLVRLKRSLEVYAAPLRALRIDKVTTDDIVQVLKPIWAMKTETARKARGAIEAVLDLAKADGHRSGDNPARLSGHLTHKFDEGAAKEVVHHAAVAYVDLPAFMVEVRARDAVAAEALEFLILTAARTGEVLGVRWDEIDLKAKTWTVPAARMKARVEHCVPLAPRAVELLEKRIAAAPGDFVFPNVGGDGHLSGMAMSMLMRRMARKETVHGFRSSFRDWAGSATTFPRELAELALAHTVGDSTERAYRRDAALEKRRTMMDAWAEYLGPK